MLAMADKEGRVWASVPGLANRARVPVEDTEAALQTFLSPDKYSRTPDFEGRKIEAIEGGWRLINHAKYREIGNPVRASLDMEGYVYFAGVPGGDKVKIGFSKNPWARINDLRVTNPELEILATERATMVREKERHEEFKGARLSGEWFAFTPTLRSLIQALSERDSRSKPSTTVVNKVATVAADTDTDTDTDTRRSTATAPDAARRPPKKNGHRVNFNFQTGKFEGVTEGDELRWQEAYPAIAVPVEIDKAASWMRANPANRKKNYERYIVNWLSRAQERAPRINK